MLRVTVNISGFSAIVFLQLLKKECHSESVLYSGLVGNYPDFDHVSTMSAMRAWLRDANTFLVL